MPDKTMQLKVSNRVPAHIVDGHQIFINEQNGDVSVMFLQVFPLPADPNGALEAGITNHVRMSYEQAEKLCETLKNALDDFKKKQKRQ